MKNNQTQKKKKKIVYVPQIQEKPMYTHLGLHLFHPENCIYAETQMQISTAKEDVRLKQRDENTNMRYIHIYIYI